MFQSGAFIANHFADLAPTQKQPNGVDLTIDSVYRQTESGSIRRNGKTIGDRTAVNTDDGTYNLFPRHYIVVYGETITIPEQHIGFVLPRSSLLRNSCMLNTAVWDSGYQGRGEGLLVVNHEISIESGARIGQLVLAEANHDGTYDGTYQDERL